MLRTGGVATIENFDATSPTHDVLDFTKLFADANIAADITNAAKYVTIYAIDGADTVVRFDPTGSNPSSGAVVAQLLGGADFTANLSTFIEHHAVVV